MRMQRMTLFCLSALIAASSSVWAQGQPAAAPAAPPQANTPAAAEPAAADAGAPPEAYTYQVDGRRDPFVSLVARGTEAPTGPRSAGLGGITTSELMVRGVLQSKGRAHVNDRLMDGTIRSVTPQGVVIMQEVNDPLSLVKQREVRKGLRTSEDGK
jgi:hypothetical protein